VVAVVAGTACWKRATTATSRTLAPVAARGQVEGRAQVRGLGRGQVYPARTLPAPVPVSGASRPPPRRPPLRRRPLPRCAARNTPLLRPTAASSARCRRQRRLVHGSWRAPPRCGAWHGQGHMPVVVPVQAQVLQGRGPRRLACAATIDRPPPALPCTRRRRRRQCQTFTWCCGDRPPCLRLDPRSRVAAACRRTAVGHGMATPPTRRPAAGSGASLAPPPATTAATRGCPPTPASPRQYGQHHPPAPRVPRPDPGAGASVSAAAAVAVAPPRLRRQPRAGYRQRQRQGQRQAGSARQEGSMPTAGRPRRAAGLMKRRSALRAFWRVRGR